MNKTIEDYFWGDYTAILKSQCHPSKLPVNAQSPNKTKL